MNKQKLNFCFRRQERVLKVLAGKLWSYKAKNKNVADHLVKELGLNPKTAQILVNRGILTLDEAKKFLNPLLNYLEDPFKLPNMERAIERILEARKKGERILIYGDYDVDGITSTALLVDFLKRHSFRVDYYIPERLEEGYGLNKNALFWAKNTLNCDLVITVDCGISGFEEIDLAKSYCLDIVITDHHEPGPLIPAATAVVNPKLERENCFQHLAGVGVAFKLAQALAKELNLPSTEIENLLDLAALGTVADVVPLIGENRIIVKHGLAVLNQLKRPGLKALVEVAGLEGKFLNTGHIAFALAPRLNAVGRLGNASPAVELLLTDSNEYALELASKLAKENNERQAVETKIYEEVCNRIEQEIDFREDRVIVLASPAWHSGVIGIVAAKIVEKYYRPTVLLSIENDYAKGSGRSVKSFDLFKALQHCSNSLEKFGGHFYAAGLTLRTEKINEFRSQLNNYAKKHLRLDQLIPEEDFDLEIKLEEIDSELIEEIRKLEPFGVGNPEPVFCARRIHLENPRGVGKKANHLKCRIVNKNNVFDAIGFKLADQLDEKDTDFKNEMNILFTLQENQWNGNSCLQLNIKDLSSNLPLKELLQLNMDLSSFWEEEFQKSFIIRVPLRKISAGMSFLLEDPLLYKGIKLIRVDGQLSFCENSLASKHNLVLVTDQFYTKYQKTLENNSVRIIDYTELIDKGAGKEKIIDYRGREKEKVLEELLLQGGKILIICNSKEKAENLAREILTKFRLNLNCDSVLNVYGKDDLYNLILRQEEVRIVITHQLLEFYRWFNYDIKVIFDAPFSLDEFRLRTLQLKNKPVLLLWNEEDLVYNRTMLQAMFPEVPLLKQVLSFMANNCKKGELLTFNWLTQGFAATDKNKNNYIFLLAALKIFEELGIVTKQRGCYYYQAVPEDIVWEKSACFLEGIKEKRAFKDFINSPSFWESSLEVG